MLLSYVILSFGERSHWHLYHLWLLNNSSINATDYPLKIIANHFHCYMISVFKNEKGIFVQYNTSCQMTRSELVWFQEHNTEFQLTSWSPNMTDHNQTEPISCVSQWLSKAQKQPFLEEPGNVRQPLEQLMQSSTKNM